MQEIEDIILWPDGTWCYRHELTPHIGLFGDELGDEHGIESFS